MASTRLIALIIAALSISHFTTIYADQSNPELQSKLKSFATAGNAEQAKYLTTTLALFYVIDEKYAHKALEKAPDYSQFRDRVDDWIKEDTARWQQIRTHLDYCEQLRREGKLGTDIDADDVDIRWVFFIVYGEPSSVLVLPCRCIRGDGACSLWTYTWLPSEANEPGWELSCRSRPDESYPTEFVPNDDASFLSTCPIWPMVNCSRFPAANGMSDVWFSVWIPGNQFTRPTLDSARLTINVEIYDSSRTVPVIKGHCTSDLQVIRGILEVTEPWDRYRIRAMGYLGFADFEPGRYAAHVIVAGAHNNDGDIWVEFEIPSNLRISDLLLVKESAGVGDNINPGITRADKDDLFDNPEAIFARGERLNLYVESQLPLHNPEIVEVWVTILPMPEIPKRAKTKVSIGESIVVADSLDNPILSDKWQTPEERKMLKELDYSQSDSKAITLVKKRISVSGDDMIIELSPSLNNDLKTGQYLLTVSIYDPNHKSDILTARRLIKVASAVSNTAKNRFRTSGR